MVVFVLVAFIMHPAQQSKASWAGCILIFWQIQIFLHILGQENATFEADPVTIAKLSCNGYYMY